MKFACVTRANVTKWHVPPVIGGDVTIEFVIGETAVLVNGKEKQMDVPAKIIGGRTLVPMRFLSEALGYNVIWNEEARIVSVDKL